MSEATLGGRFTFPGTSFTVRRIGHGAMQLTGPGVWGPPKDPDGAVAVLREAVAAGVNHIDTADFCPPRRQRPDRRLGPARHRVRAVLPARRLHAAAVFHLSSVAPARGDADAGRAGVAVAPVAQHPLDPRHLVGRAPAREPSRWEVEAAAGNPGGVGRDSDVNSLHSCLDDRSRRAHLGGH